MKNNSFKMRFGVIGTNFVVDWLLNASRFDSRFQLVAIYSRTQEKADAFAAKYNIPYVFTSLEEMASSSLIDAVYVASPNSLHASQSILFMEQGKHVLCEKPLASNEKEVELMIKTADKNKVVLMEAMKATMNPNFRLILKYINEIGTVRRYFSSYCQYSSRYDKLRGGEFPNAFNPEFSNGAVMDLGVYTIYPMVVLFGRPKTIDALGLRLSTGVDGQGAVNFEYDNMNATVLYSKIANSYLPTELQGEKGTIIADRIDTIRELKINYNDGKKLDLSYPMDKDEFYYEIVEFLDLIETGKKESSINSHKNSLLTIQIVDEIRRQLGIIFPADQK